jgi:cytochrome P450
MIEQGVFVSALADTRLPLLRPIIATDKSEIEEIFVPRSTNVIVSILGANRSQDIWGQDAYEWKPERWLSALPKTVTDAHLSGVYTNMLVPGSSSVIVV